MTTRRRRRACGTRRLAPARPTWATGPTTARMPSRSSAEVDREAGHTDRPPGSRHRSGPAGPLLFVATGARPQDRAGAVGRSRTARGEAPSGVDVVDGAVTAR